MNDILDENLYQNYCWKYLNFVSNQLNEFFGRHLEM